MTEQATELIETATLVEPAAKDDPAHTQKATEVAVQSKANGSAATNSGKQRPSRRRREPEPEELSNPVIRRKVTLDTLQAQRILMRHMKYVSGSLHNLSVVMHVVGDPKDAEATEKIVLNAMKEAEAALDAAIERSVVMIKNAGETEAVTEDIVYSHSATMSVELKSPLDLHYLNAIYKLETLVKNIDWLWWAKEINSGQRSSTNADWQRTMRRLAIEIISIQKRAINAAYNKGKRAELDKHNLKAVEQPADEDTELDEAEDFGEDDQEQEQV